VRGRVYTLLGDEGGDFASQSRDVVFALLVSDLHFAFFENLAEEERHIQVGSKSPKSSDEGETHLSNDRVSIVRTKGFLEVV
jgi:hypothetical protein